MGSSTEHSAYGPTRNPWDLDRIPGGSGGGSAAAVAAFEAPLALGSDTGGSIRQPAHVTGTVGIKPTYGGVSRYGAIALASSLDQVGPVTRTVLDAGLLHDVIGGHDPHDSTSLARRLAVVRRGRPRGRPRRRAQGPQGRRHPRAARQRLPGRGLGVVPRRARRDGGAGRRDRRDQRAALRVRRRRVLPDPPGRGIQQSREVRLGALRPAGRRPRRHRRGRHGDDPRRRLRRRGQAPHHPRHLRAVGGLLRRLLRLGAEGAHAHPARLRRGVRAVDVIATPVGADDGVPARREDRRPAADVPERRDDDSGEPRRRARASRSRPASPPRTACRSASSSWRPRARTRACTASARRSKRCSSTRGAARCWTGPRPSARTEGHADGQGQAAGLRQGPRALRAGARLRGARRAQHRDQDVLGRREPRALRQPRRRAEHARRPGRHGPARLAPGRQREAVRYSISLGLALGCSIAPVEPVRAEELLLPRPRQELPDLAVRRADRLRGLGRRRARRRHDRHGADRARAHGRGCRQADARRRLDRPHPGRRVLARRLQPRGRAARRDRHEADLRRRAPRARDRQGVRRRRSATS